MTPGLAVSFTEQGTPPPESLGSTESCQNEDRMESLMCSFVTSMSNREKGNFLIDMMDVLNFR